MKKVLIVLVFVLTAGSLFAVSAGFNVGLTPMWMNTEISNGFMGPYNWTFTGSQNYINIGGWVDFDYVRLTVSYEGSLGTESDGLLTNGASVTNGLVTTNSTTYINLELLGKLPIKISDGFNIWPAIGLEYAICLFDGFTTTNTLTNLNNNDRNDFFLKAGVGADIKIGENIYLAPVVMFGWDLTPIPYLTTDQNIKEGTSGAYTTYADYIKDKIERYSQFKLNISIGLGFKF